MGVRLLRCSDCRESDRTVAALMARHPRAVAQLGPAGAEAMFTRMLEALTVLGRPLPDDADVPVLSRHLSRFGLVFRLRFVPVARAEDDRAKCSPRPWAHVDEETRTELRSAYAAYLHEKAVAGAPPLEIPPPAADSTRGAPVDGGCLFCGRATVTTPAREAGRAVWRPLTASASALGSRVARQVTGHLCPDCSQARDEVGATGVPAMDRALHRYLKDAGRDAEARQVVQGETYGLVAWGVLARREPTTEPWAHVVVSLTDEREIPVWSAPPQPARRPRKAAKRKAAASPAGTAPAAPASTPARRVDITRF